MKDPRAALKAALAGIARLGELVRDVVDFSKTYEFLHVQYNQGLQHSFVTGPLPLGGSRRSTTMRIYIWWGI